MSSKFIDLNHYRNDNEVARYLQVHPELIDFLQESHYHLTRLFGTAATFTLEVVSDLEADYQPLMVYINTSLPLDRALELLDKLDDEWYLDHIQQLGHLVNFNLEIA